MRHNMSIDVVDVDIHRDRRGRSGNESFVLSAN